MNFNDLPRRKDFVIYPVHDFGFKALMGHKLDLENTLIKDFLKAVFHREFEIIEFKDREMTPSHFLGKKIRLDLRVKCEGVEINLEMQMFPTGNESERALYYTCMAIEAQNMSGKSYKELEAVHQIFLLAQNTNEFKHPVEHFELLNSETGRPLTDKMKISIISLERIVEGIKDFSKMTDLQKWCLFFCCGHLSHHEGIQNLLTEERFRKAEMIMREINQDELLKDAAFQKMKDELDRRTRTQNEMRRAKEEGLALGKAEGLALGKVEGKAEARIETAIQLIQMGMEDLFIAKAIGFTVEEVREIRNNQ